MQITNKSERYTWKQFGKDINGLNWYDVVTSFIFRFFAKTSEPLLAAGIIISAIDFLQRGQLLAHNAELSLWWSIAQGVAMEVSVGPVLVCSLDAREEGDILKAWFYGILSALLAFVGGAMLLLQFGSSIAGLTETQINPWVLWPLFFLRTVASIGYIALSCTKHKRFSGTISPKVALAETNRAFTEAMSRIALMHEQMGQAVARLEQTTTSQMREMRREVSMQLSQAQTALDNRLVGMEALTEQRLQEVYQGFVQEVSVVKVTLEEQSKVIRRIPEQTVSVPSLKVVAKEVSVAYISDIRKAFRLEQQTA